jgi:hypothetical protein
VTIDAATTLSERAQPDLTVNLPQYTRNYAKRAEQARGNDATGNVASCNALAAHVGASRSLLAPRAPSFIPASVTLHILTSSV